MDTSLQALAAGIADRYEVERELGRGGMATVYLARDIRHGRRVAVKVMRPEVAASVGSERFLREVRVAAQLNHPRVLSLHDSGRVPMALPGASTSGTSSDLLYYVMPYVEGESLRDWLRREGQLALANALRIASEVADALSFAHSHGVIHRDIKPENILLAGHHAGSSGSWHALVADFGIARLLADTGTALTATGVSVGTPAYMSPEQATGERTLDARADIYSLGCVLYEMLVGEAPFTGPTASAIIARHLTAPVASIRTVRPSVPAELESVIRRALEKVPADRTATADAFKADVDRLRARLGAPDADAAGTGSAPHEARGVFHHVVSGRASWPRRAVLAAAIAFVALAGSFTMARVRAGGSASIDTTARAARALDRTRIAVMPLRMVGDSVYAYLADASTDELISALSRVGQLRVLARSSVESIDGKARSAAEVGRAIAAGSVVEGTFRQRGDSVRFDVTLVDANTGDNLWSGHYARRVRDVSGIQDSVAMAVAERVTSPAGNPLATAPGGAPPRPNGAAHIAYLRGHWVEGRSRQGAPAPAIEDSAIALYRQALSLDSTYAEAHAAIAGVYADRYFLHDPNPLWEERAFVEIGLALRLDPNLAEAYQEQGNLTWTLSKGFPHAAAAKLHRKAARLKPSLIGPHESLGSIYMHVGLLDRALNEYNVALELDPSTMFVPPRIARVHWYQGNYAEALQEFAVVPRLGASFIAERALVMSYLGNPTEALAWLDSAARATPNPGAADLDAARAVIYASQGNRRRAIDAIGRAARGSGSHFHHTAYAIAQAYSLLGDRDKSLQFLRRTADEGMPCYPLFRDDPHLRPLASDPRFVQFMDEMRQRWEHLAKTLE